MWRGGVLLRYLSIQCFVLPVLAYQCFIAPLIVDCCRWYPCCSQYAREAITKHGVAKGVWLCVRRLVRCHPWGGSGYDPVP
ncbi:MAG: membrane protein insertion efficiency factor YidD [Amoebophilaceae bacterium]|nr:membrane protein insertion efficiency factor YidD [Amoebophilaceae bacterium]